MTKCSFCTSQNSQQGALNWLAGQVRVLLKRMENLENGSSKVPLALDTLIVSSPVTVQGGRTEIYGQIAPVFSEYIAPQPAACYATSVPIGFAAPAPVVERTSPDFPGYAVPVPVVESSPAAPAPVVEYVSLDPAEYVAPACVVKYIAAETAVSHPAPVPTVLAVSVTVVEHTSPAPAVCAAPVTMVEHITPAPVASYGVPVAPAVYAAPVPVVKYVAPAALVPVVEHISPDPTVYAAKSSCGGVHRSSASVELFRGSHSACCTHQILWGRTLLQRQR